MEDFPLWIDHLAALFYGIIIPSYATWQRPKGLPGYEYSTDLKKRIYISGSLTLWILAVILLVIWIIFRRPFSGLGFSATSNSGEWFWWVLVFVLLYAADVTRSVYSDENLQKSIRQWQDRTPFTPTRKKEIPLYLVMCASAGICEEIIYRGFMVSYCLQLFSFSSANEIWATTVPGLLFAAGHYYQGSRAVMKIFILSVLFGFIFLRSGSLFPVIILHFLVDAAGGLLSYRYLNKNKENETIIMDERQDTEE